MSFNRERKDLSTLPKFIVSGFLWGEFEEEKTHCAFSGVEADVITPIKLFPFPALKKKCYFFL